MKILVIGGAGFIGSHFIESVSSKNNIELVIVDDFSTGNIENISSLPLTQEVRIVTGDFTELANLPEEHYDKIYNFAAKIDARSELISDYMNNVCITAKSIGNLKHNGEYHFMSSCAVYGCSENAKETDSPATNTLYGLSKSHSEDLINECVENKFIYRLGNVYGERQDGTRESGVISIILNCIKNNISFKMYNEGNSTRDYIYVKDVIGAILTDKEPGTYNVGTGFGLKTSEIVHPILAEYENGGFRKETDKLTLNTSKLRNLGWKPSSMTPVSFLKNSIMDHKNV